MAFSIISRLLAVAVNLFSTVSLAEEVDDAAVAPEEDDEGVELRTATAVWSSPFPLSLPDTASSAAFDQSKSRFVASFSALARFVRSLSPLSGREEIKFLQSTKL